MKISIVTISFNQSQFIEKCIRSVISQKDIDLEYIIVDAGSTDGSREIIMKYQSSISKIIFENDNGAADGLNKGFQNATGQIFGFINSDDMLMPDALKKVLHFFNENKNADVLLGRGYIIDEHDRRLKYIIPSQFSVRRFVTGGFRFIQQGMFFKRQAFESCHGFNSNNITCWDGELLLDMGLADNNIICGGDDIGYFRMQVNSITSTGKLNHQYNLEKERLFLKAMGRGRLSIDYIYNLIYLIKKMLINK